MSSLSSALEVWGSWRFFQSPFQLPALAWLSWHKTGNQFVSIRFNQWFSGFRVVLTEDLPQNGYHDVQFSIVEPLNKNWEPNRLDPPVVVHQCCVPFCWIISYNMYSCIELCIVSKGDLVQWPRKTHASHCFEHISGRREAWWPPVFWWRLREFHSCQVDSSPQCMRRITWTSGVKVGWDEDVGCDGWDVVTGNVKRCGRCW